MTGWGVLRSTRTADPTSSTVPAGVAAHMPPHSQGAERRTGRWGLRALVIGGLAGAAWLLTGAAAHAADRDPAPQGLPLLGSVVDSDTVHPAVTGLLHAVTRPLESDSAASAHRDPVSTILAVPAQVVSGPATTLTTTLGEATRGTSTTGSDTATGGVVRVVRDITGPLRLHDGSGVSPLAPVSQPLTTATRHHTGSLPQAVEPAGTAPRPVAAPVAHRATPVSTTATEFVPVAHATGHITIRHAVAEAAEPDTIRENQPGGNGPAPTPMQVHFGAISGISTSGSGAPTEGGSAAFLPAAGAAGPMALHRKPRATHVEVRRLIAEAPTVSPD
jgi:hypothetical protein